MDQEIVHTSVQHREAQISQSVWRLDYRMDDQSSLLTGEIIFINSFLFNILTNISEYITLAVRKQSIYVKHKLHTDF
jgi:hypothetical protein